MSLRSVLAFQRAIRLSDLRKRVTCDRLHVGDGRLLAAPRDRARAQETGSAEADPQAAQCSYASPTTTTRTYSRPRSSLSCSRSPRAPSDVGLIRERCRRFGRSAVSGGSGGERFGAWSPKGGRPFLYLNKRPVTRPASSECTTGSVREARVPLGSGSAPAPTPGGAAPIPGRPAAARSRPWGRLPPRRAVS